MLISSLSRNQAFFKGGLQKHLEILEELFPGYENAAFYKEPARKGYAGTMFLYKKQHQRLASQEIVPLLPWTWKAASSPWKFDTFFVTGIHSKRWRWSQATWKSVRVTRTSNTLVFGSTRQENQSLAFGD